MKFSAVFLVIAVIGVFLMWYCFNYRPVVEWQNLQVLIDQKQLTTHTEVNNLIVNLYRQGEIVNYLNKQSIILLSIGMFMAVFGFISSLHSAIDKIFFKKFYESPHLFIAIRRGVLAGILPVVFFIIGLYNYTNLTVIILVILVAISLELIFISLTSRTNPQLTQLPDEGKFEIKESNT